MESAILTDRSSSAGLKSSPVRDAVFLLFRFALPVSLVFWFFIKNRKALLGACQAGKEGIIRKIYRPAVKVMIFQEVVEQLQDAILKRYLKTNQKLPSETKLMKLFHTRRATIREALRVLALKGLLQIKTGRRGGAYVLSSPADLTMEDITLLIKFGKISLTDLAEFRMTMEGALTRKAANQATVKDIKATENLLLMIRACLGADGHSGQRFIDLDKKLHLRIAKISGNPFEVHLLKSIYATKEYFVRFHKMTSQAVENNYQDLSEIVEAVAHHRSGKAYRVAVRHVEQFDKFRKC